MDTIQERASALTERANRDYPEAWRPDKDSPETLVGVVAGYEKATSEYGEKDIMAVRDVDGKEWSVWLIHAALVAAVARERPQIGELVLIRYQGEKTSATSGRRYHAYRLEVEREQRAPDFDAMAADAGGVPLDDESPAGAFAKPEAKRESGDDDIPF